MVFYTDFPHAFSVPTGHKLESNQALELFKLPTKCFMIRNPFKVITVINEQDNVVTVVPE